MAKAGAPDTRWLMRKAQGWYAVQDVPRPMRAILGKKRLVKSLATRDLVVARARRHAALAEFAAIFAGASPSSAAVDAGMAWRETLARIDRGDHHAVRAFAGHSAQAWNGNEMVPLSGREVARDVADAVLFDEAASLRDRAGDAAADTMLAVAQGRATPLTHYVAAWLAEGGAKGPLNARTRRQYQSDVTAFETWCRTAGVALTIEAITKAVAGRWITEAMVAASVDRKTANRKISALSAYWRWLLKRTAVETNPWQGQSLPKMNRAAGEERSKRPFTDAEMLALMEGKADAELSDAMRIAALSGMRIEEIYRLTIADCAGAWFNVRRGKTAASVRRVPQHSGLAGLVTARCKDKAPDAYLFPEPGPLRPGRERSMAASKRFGTYRRSLAIDDKAEGRRQSRADFHSFRRWFITKARDAGIDRAVVAAVVGHETGNITDDLYSGGPNDARKRACVEAVQLPVRHLAEAA